MARRRQNYNRGIDEPPSAPNARSRGRRVQRRGRSGKGGGNQHETYWNWGGWNVRVPYFPWTHHNECFVAGTKVIMKHGSDKNIEDVIMGDEVLSYNVHSKQFEPKKVTELFTQTHNLKDGDITVKITFDNGTTTHNTIANPFYSKDKGFVAVDEERCNRVHAWVKTTNNNNDVSNLTMGDTVFSYNEDDGELNEVQVENIEYVMDNDIRTYDIQVEETHTFFANGILTHNSGGGGGPGDDDWGGDDEDCMDCYG